MIQRISTMGVIMAVTILLPTTGIAQETSRQEQSTVITLPSVQTWTQEGYETYKIENGDWLLKFVIDGSEAFRSADVFPMEACWSGFREDVCRVAVLDKSSREIRIYGRFVFPQTAASSVDYGWGTDVPYVISENGKLVVYSAGEEDNWFLLDPISGIFEPLVDLRSYVDYESTLPLQSEGLGTFFGRFKRPSWHSDVIFRIGTEGRVRVEDTHVAPPSFEPFPDGVSRAVEGHSDAPDFLVTDESADFYVGRQSEGVYVIQPQDSGAIVTRLGYTTNKNILTGDWYLPNPVQIVGEQTVAWTNRESGGEIFVAELDFTHLPDTGFYDPPNRIPYRTSNDPTVYGYDLADGVWQPVKYCTESVFTSVAGNSFEHVVHVSDQVRVPLEAPCGGNPHPDLALPGRTLFVRYGIDPYVYFWNWYAKFEEVSVTKLCDESDVWEGYHVMHIPFTRPPTPQDFDCQDTDGGGIKSQSRFATKHSLTRH